jgi:hypothetical protein
LVQAPTLDSLTACVYLVPGPSAPTQTPAECHERRGDRLLHRRRTVTGLMHQKLFGGLSMACDFADLVQNEFCTRPVALLQGLFGPRSRTSPAVSRLNIHPQNSFSGHHEHGRDGAHDIRQHLGAGPCGILLCRLPLCGRLFRLQGPAHYHLSDRGIVGRSRDLKNANISRLSTVLRRWPGTVELTSLPAVPRDSTIERDSTMVLARLGSSPFG